jgi:metal-responsive CopG/Arc/MetJ family transcriptional regulator
MAKIAISLPDEVFQVIEKERLARKVSRSEFFRRAVEVYLRREQERQWDEQYVRAYRENPETAEEVALAEATLGYAFAESPWDADAEE